MLNWQVPMAGRDVPVVSFLIRRRRISAPGGDEPDCAVQRISDPSFTAKVLSLPVLGHSTDKKRKQQPYTKSKTLGQRKYEKADRYI